MGRHGVHHDHVPFVIGRELEGAAERLPVHHEDAVVRLELDPLDLVAAQEHPAEIVVRALQERELERHGQDRARPAVGDGLSGLPKQRRAIGAALRRQRARGPAGWDLDAERRDGADVRAGERLPAAAVENGAVRGDGRHRAGRGDDRVRDAEAGDVHADGRGQRRERGREGPVAAGEHARRHDHGGAGEPHATPAYTSGFSTPMNGRLR